MRNKTNRITSGMAQRALALLLTLALLTGFFPASALAEISNEANEAPQTTELSQQNASTDEATSNNITSPSGESNSSSSTTTGQGNTSETTNQPASSNAADSVKPLQATANNQKNNTVSATLKISVYGTVLVNHAFDIAAGSTVEDLMNLAQTQRYIDGYETNQYDNLFVKSITINGTPYTAPAYDPNNPSPYWASTINGQYDMTGLDGTTITNNGFSYELDFVIYGDSSTSFDNGTGDYKTNPDATHPDSATTNGTTSFTTGSGKTSDVTSAATSESNAEIAWKQRYEGTFGGNNISEILTVGSDIFFAEGAWGSTATLHCLDIKTGEEKGSLLLFGAIDYTCRPIYSDGIIVVPLSGGRLQGVAASSLTTLWVSAPVDNNKTYNNIQNVSSLTVFNNTVYTGTLSSLDGYIANRGVFFGLDIKTGALKWKNLEENTGFYWSGACVVNNALIYGNDAGILCSVNPETGKIISTLSLGKPIRSTVTTNGNGEAFVATNDGTVHKISVSNSGELTEQSTVNFNGSQNCTSSATYYNGKLFIGGATAGQEGILAVIDAATMKIEHLVTVPSEIKSTPLVATAEDGNTYVYFTYNGPKGSYPNYTSGGEIWVYKVGDSSATQLAKLAKEDYNYATKSLSLSSDGTLFWSNDSGTVFALRKATSGSNTTPSSPSGESGTPSNTPQGTTPTAPQSAPAAQAAPTTAGAPAAQAPLTQTTEEKTDAKDSEKSNSVEATSFRGDTTRNTSSNNNSDSIPWLPYAGIAVGVVGLIGVGIALFRRLKA